MIHNKYQFFFYQFADHAAEGASTRASSRSSSVCSDHDRSSAESSEPAVNSLTAGARIKQRRSTSPAENVLKLIGERIISSRPEDEFDIVGKNVATKLRKMTADMQLLAEKLINDVLYQGLSGKLTTNTELKDSSTPYPFTYVSPLTPLQMSVQDDTPQGQQTTINYI